MNQLLLLLLLSPHLVPPSALSLLLEVPLALLAAPVPTQLKKNKVEMRFQIYGGNARGSHILASRPLPPLDFMQIPFVTESKDQMAKPHLQLGHGVVVGGKTCSLLVDLERPLF